MMEIQQKSVDRERFLQNYRRLMSFMFKEDDTSRTNLNLLLDELNSVDYSQKIVNEEEANNLLNHLVKITPLYEERLVVKVCLATHNLTAKQQLSLTDHVLRCNTEFLIQSLKRCQPWARLEILLALGAVVYENVGRLTQFHEVLLGKQGILMPLIEGEASSEDILRGAVQCVENLTLKVYGYDYMENALAYQCFCVFLKLLHNIPSAKMDPNTQCKILICVLRGLQNILSVTKVMPNDQLGQLLAGVRAYMFHGMSTNPLSVPESLYPTPRSQYDPNPSPSKTDSEPQNARGQGNDEKSGGGEISLRPGWSKISSSESEYSDTEGGQGSRLRSSCAKVRQCALGCLHATIKNTEKRLMFGYWSSFIPDSTTMGNSPQLQTLFTIVLKDPSPKCRMGALAALTAMMEGTKTFLAAAEDIEQTNAAFTPFSSVLGSTIRELHRCLLLALVSENYPLTLTQLIKCISTLVGIVPYHRMKPGLLSRVIKQVRNFLGHRDPNVRVACLTCFGALASIQPPLMEVCHILQPAKPPTSTNVRKSSSDHGQEPTNKTLPQTVLTAEGQPDSGFSSGHENSTTSQSENVTNDVADSNLFIAQGRSPGNLTPNTVSPGTQTPLFTDQMLQSHFSEGSWLIRLCVKNILPYSGSRFAAPTEDVHTEPLPVRLESLQVLAHLAKGYFPIMRGSVTVLLDVITKCFCDQDEVVRLHTAKMLDDLSQAMLKDITPSDLPLSGRLSVDKVCEFWISLLNGPVSTVLQSETNSSVKATTCDCVANIGPDVFAVLGIDKRILCITLMLGLTADDCRVTRSAAVRTLGVFVLYPCLREDVSFVADAANAILTCMDDTTLTVRFKAAWSLGNLCDALVINKNENDTEFTEDFSDMLLQKIFSTTIKACQDSDKVKSNGVRALGNTLRYLTNRSLGKSSFRQSVDDGVRALVKSISSGTMKVRWNACYAVSNMFKNPLLNHNNSEMMKELIFTLCSVVKDCKNFKVRINAAVALGAPSLRSHYGDVSLYHHVWESLVKGLQTAEEITEFGEFRYRNQLNNQICSSLLHLVVVLELSDLDSLQPLVDVEADIIAEHFDRFRTITADNAPVYGESIKSFLSVHQS
ncbi:hypothetical protein FSP39_009229 [Pinctada imbricata]|uniref:HEAT repeat-containing protein 6 n=1 Tax=Pinctada imbricata TaxID=66713 RepID=A0AA89BQW4_PINIB|nr:hypothetical protein FSP39_009229 [Pinctada imbricata]